MFVGSSYLGSIDRLSPTSILTSKSGACLGFLLTIVFIIIGIILFIGPTISDFKNSIDKITMRQLDTKTSRRSQAVISKWLYVFTLNKLAS